MIAAGLAGLERVFGGLLTASWQASVLAFLVLGLQWALRGKLNPRWRYALWLLVLVRLLLPIQFASPLSLFQFEPDPLRTLTMPMTEPLFTPGPIAGNVVVGISQKAVESAPLSISPYSMLALVWLVGAATLGCLTFEANRRFMRQVANTPEITDAAMLRLFDSARAELSIRRSIRLIESAQISSPAIMGLIRPTLLLPMRTRETFDQAELRLIFLHELAHLKRGDVVVQSIIALLQILHWFNPMLWFAFRRMRADREPAADALVLSRAGEAEKERYGLMLIKMLEHFHKRHSLPTLVGILEDKDQFKRRFQLIARYTTGAYGWSVLGVLLIAALSCACLTRSTTREESLQATPLTSNNPASPALPQNAATVNALTKAVIHNDVQLVKRLLQNGANPNQVGADKRNIFSKCRNAIMVKLLLNSGANPNVAEEEGPSLAYAPDVESVQLLMQHGANIHAVSKAGLSVIPCAILSGARDDSDVIAELIRQGADFDPKGQSGAMALGYAAAYNDVKIMKLLMDHGLSPNVYGEGNYMEASPLGMASFRPDAKAVALLLERGANPDGDPRETVSPLSNAVMFNETDNVRLLRAAGARDVGELSMAAATGDSAKVTVLLQSGVDVNESDRAGSTPLHYAVRRGQVETATLLLTHGANINQFNALGITAVDSFDMMAESFNPNQATMNWGVSKDEGKRRVVAFRALFKKYPQNPHYTDGRGRTALHQMAYSGCTEFSIDDAHRANLNACDHEGNTPLMLAALSPHARDLTMRVTTEGDSSQKSIAWNSQAFIADQLIKSGANLNLVVRNGKTVGELALAAAESAHNPQLISVLLAAAQRTTSVAPPVVNPESEKSGAAIDINLKLDDVEFSLKKPLPDKHAWASKFSNALTSSSSTVPGDNGQSTIVASPAAIKSPGADSQNGIWLGGYVDTDYAMRFPGAVDPASVKPTFTGMISPAASTAPSVEHVQNRTEGVAAIIDGYVIKGADVLEVSGTTEKLVRQRLSGAALDQHIDMLRQSVLHALIDRRLMLEYFKKSGGLIPSSYLDDRVADEIKERFGNDRQVFLQTLAARKETLNSYRQGLADDAIISYLHGREIEEKLWDYYQTHLDLFPTDEQLNVTLITIPFHSDKPGDLERMHATAEQALEQIHHGADIESVGKGFPRLFGRANSGWLTKDSIGSSLSFPPIWQGIQNLRSGELSGVIEGPWFFVIAKVNQRREPKIPATEQTAQQRVQLIEAERQRLSHSWMDPLRAQAQITYYPPFHAIDLSSGM